MNDSPRNVALQSGLYTQIALYAAGNALSLAVFLMLYHTSAVLSDFRDPMLYALLCSIALRGPKDWLVQQVEARLSQQGNVTLSLLAACMPPYLAVRWLWREGRDAIAAFRAKVKDIQDEYQRNRVGLKSNIVQLREGGVGPGTPPTSNSGGAESGPQGGSKSSTAVPTRPMSLSIYAKAGLQTLHSRKDRARRRRRATSRVRAPSSASSRLLAWLFMLCLLWAGYEWIRVGVHHFAINAAMFMLVSLLWHRPCASGDGMPPPNILLLACF